MANKDFKVKNGLDVATPVPITMGGTGQTSATNALNSMLPSQAGHANKVLLSDGTNTSWIAQSVAYQRGGTASRPASPTAGDLYYNTDYNYFESYTANGWFPIAAAPGIPTGVTATNQGTSRAFNNGQMSVAFTAATNGGAPTSFILTPNPATSPTTFTGSTSPIVVTGLSSSTQYTHTVVSTSPYGTSSASSASSAVTATTVPQAPSITSVTGGNLQADIAFTANGTGGSAITSYSIISSPETTTQTASSSPYTFTGLTNGTAYTFTVTATNANGTSVASSASSSVTPALSEVAFIAGVNYSGANINVSRKTNLQLSPGIIYNGGAGSGIGNSPSYWVQNVAGREFTKKYSLTGYSGYSISNILGDSSGNVYIGYQNNSTVSRLSKINSDNTVAWTKSYGFNYISLHAISSDGSQLLTTHANYENDTYMVINSSDGSVSYSGNGSGYSVMNMGESVFSPNALYTSGYLREPGGNRAWVARILRSNNSTSYRKAFDEGTVATSLFIDSSENAYLGFYSGSGCGFAKVDSSGAVQWQKQFGSGQQYPQLGAVDSAGNVYVGHNAHSAHYILKFNSSGTLQWQRTLTGSANTSNSGQIAILNDNLFMATFSASDGSYVSGYQAILPTDGSKTGTYTVAGKTISYAASSLAVNSSGFGIGNFGSYSAGSYSATTQTNPGLTTFANTTGSTVI